MINSFDINPGESHFHIEIRIPKTEIEKRDSSAVSMMPSGLIAYLSSLGEQE